MTGSLHPSVRVSECVIIISISSIKIGRVIRTTNELGTEEEHLLAASLARSLARLAGRSYISGFLSIPGAMLQKILISATGWSNRIQRGKKKNEEHACLAASPLPAWLTNRASRRRGAARRRVGRDDEQAACLSITSDHFVSVTSNPSREFGPIITDAVEHWTLSTYVSH